MSGTMTLADFAALLQQQSAMAPQPNTLKSILGQPEQPRELPTLGPLPGQAFLNDLIAPKVPPGMPRPLAPGEYIQNPDGSWSSEITATIGAGDAPKLNAGKATVVPTLWIVDGKPVRVDEDTAADYALRSGLKFQSFNTDADAEAYSVKREEGWQSVKPTEAGKIPALWGVVP